MRATATLCLLALLAPGAALARRPKKEVGIPAKLVGKIYLDTRKAMDLDEAALVRRFVSLPVGGRVKRSDGDKWSPTVVAFFRKRSMPGPTTVWFYDKSDKAAIKAKQPTHLVTISAPPTLALVHTFDLFGDDGFNKGRTYLVRIGQIVKRRPKIYATGEITLMP